MYEYLIFDRTPHGYTQNMETRGEVSTSLDSELMHAISTQWRGKIGCTSFFLATALVLLRKYAQKDDINIAFSLNTDSGSVWNNGVHCYAFRLNPQLDFFALVSHCDSFLSHADTMMLQEKSAISSKEIHEDQPIIIFNPPTTQSSFIGISYNEAFFLPPMMENMVKQWKAIIEYAMCEAQAHVHQPLLLNSFSLGPASLLVEEEGEKKPLRTIWEQFEKQAKEIPDAIGLVDGERIFTYSTIAKKASILSCKLRTLGVKKGDRVALLATRSAESIIAILAILRCNACYVPLNPKDPDVHLKTILSDCSPSLLITEGDRLQDACSSARLAFSDLFYGSENGKSERMDSLEEGNSEDLAYVIYTSGTTGKPKGVMVSNRNVLHLAFQPILRPKKGKHRILAQTGQLAFDASTFEIWSTLLFGGTLHLLSDEILLNGERFEDYLKQEKVTAIFLTTALFNYYALNQPTIFSSLQILIFGGEKVSDDAVKKIHLSYPKLKLINGYGPTENTTFTTLHEVGDGYWERTPIGRPLQGTKVAIVQGTELCGLGVPGELCVYGNGVSQGYLNQEKLTKERFIKNPYGEGLLYRTGDLCRLLPDGQIDYLGRLDRQVKIRGFRIELEDIEMHIKQIDGIQAASVIAMEEEGERNLVAFIVSTEDRSDTDFAEALYAKLPEYMIPSQWIHVEQIPLTSNGKVDKNALFHLMEASADQKKDESGVNRKASLEEKIRQSFVAVLHKTSIGLDDSFFENGGHSLRAMQLVYRIREATGARIQAVDIFKNPTIRALTKWIENQGVSQEKTMNQKLPEVKKDSIYLASSAEKRMALETLLGDQTLAYNNPTWMYFPTLLSADKLKNAICSMMKRHEILRTGFLLKNEDLFQVIHDNMEPDFVVKDPLGETSVRVGERGLDWAKRIIPSLQESLIRPFDLENGPLFRLALLYHQEGTLLFLDIHHTITDAISMSCFIDELCAFYNGNSPEWPAPQYKSYSEWIRTRDWSADRRYWMEQFKMPMMPLELITDTPRLRTPGNAGDFCCQWMEDDLSIQVDKFAHQCEATRHMVYLSVFSVLLAKLSRQNDLVIGCPFAARTHVETEKMLGVFVNTLPLRLFPDNSLSFTEYLHQVKKTCLGAHMHQDYPYDMILSDLNPPRLQGHNPLFDVLFVEQNSEVLHPIMEETGAILLENPHKTAKFDLVFYLETIDGKNRIGLEYRTSLFQPDSAKRMLAHFTMLLRQVLHDPDAVLSSYSVILPEERQNILGPWNATDADYPSTKSITDLFLEQAKKTPNRVALRFENKKIDYQTLCIKAQELACSLMDHGVKKGDFVALYLERGFDMIIGIIGTLLAGAAYVPINTMYPKERVQFILDDAQVKCVLVGKLALPAKASCEILEISSLYQEKSSLPDGKASFTLSEASFPHSDLDATAYIIYTSGTSGKPKGVMITHRNVVRLLKNSRCPFVFGEEDVWTMFHSFGFDFSVWEMYGALLYGGCLVLVPEDVAKDPGAFYQLLLREQVTVLNQVPSSFYALQPFVRKEDALAVRYLIFGGEALTPSKLRPWKEKVPQCKIINMYGITETTVHVTYRELTNADLQSDCSNIGQPIPTLQTYVLQGDQLCGVGVPGELCVAGLGVAKGYLRRPKMTKERFIPNPFGKGRLYRSGDLTRFLPDGSLEYLGRIDQQVKVRGFRIELEEIAQKLRAQNGVREAAVIARKDSGGDMALFGYIVGEENLDLSLLNKKLSQSLPDYMIPSALMQIDSLPLTANGKLDRRSLPEIEYKEVVYEAPKTESEALFCHLFEEILGICHVGRHAKFFELGGHSLRAAHLVHRVFEKTGRTLRLHDVFQAQDIVQLAQILDNLQKTDQGERAAFLPVKKKTVFPMAPAQMQMYLASLRDERSLSYNIPQILSFAKRLDSKRIQRSLEEMTSLYEILRTDYAIVDGQGVQRVHSSIKIDFAQINRLEETRQKVAESLHSLVYPFNLHDAPLWRVRLLSCADGDLLFTDMHHILSDGISMQNFYHALSLLYADKHVVPPTHQYRDYVYWKREYDDSKEASYWAGVFEKEPPVLDLVTDFPRPKAQKYDGKTETALLETKTSRRLKEFAKENNWSPYMLFLGALMIMLSRYSRQEDIIVGSPFSGRSHPEMLPMLGMFVNMLALRGAPKPEKTIQQFFNEISETTAMAADHQEFPFSSLVKAVAPQQDPSRHPIFDVVLAVQTQEQAQIEIGNCQGDLLALDEETAKFDLTFNVEETPAGYRISLQYATSLFRQATAKRILGHYLTLLDSLTVANRIDMIESLSMWMPEEKKKILGEWNDTITSYPRENNVYSLFEEQCRRTPNALALVDFSREMTYRQMQEAVDQIKRKLQIHGVQAGDFVALLPTRRAESVLAICAILGLGATYVPINASFPKEKILSIIKDCKPRLLLGTQCNKELPIDQLSFSELEDSVQSWENTLDKKDKKTLSKTATSTSLVYTDSSPLQTKPEDPCYVIYTSGTTGEPKGVLISHKSVVSLISDPLLIPQSTDDGRLLQTGQLAFDASTFEIWSSFLHGGTLYLAEESVILDSQQMKELICNNKIRRMFLTTALFNQIVAEDISIFSSLSVVFFGGEDASASAVARVREQYPSLHLYNMYGPTEATTFTTAYDTKNWTDGRIPIGKPMANMQTFVMNGMRLCETGVPGELCIGGDGVALGYLGREEQTKEKFIPSPFGIGKLYRSGDLVRWLENGSIDFLGRIDKQVKIRGFRIELGEIENVLHKLSDVHDCAVLVQTDDNGGKDLVAYLVLDSEAKGEDHHIVLDRIRVQLEGRLPAYMVPSAMMILERLPLTKNGKLDKNALPKVKLASNDTYVAPTTEKEFILCKVFSDLLQIDPVGIYDNFFALGGHSLLAAQLCHRLLREYGLHLRVADVFEYRSPASIATCLKTDQKEEMALLPVAPKQDADIMTDAQKRIYLHEKMNATRDMYHIPYRLRLEGILDIDRAEQVFCQLLERHESLRTGFCVENGKFLQRVQEKVPFSIERIGTREQSGKMLFEKFIRPFDLAVPPLMRVALAKTKEGPELFLDFHHIAVDGLSIVILMKEFMTLYRGESLAEAPLFRNYSYWLRSKDRTQDKKFWDKMYEKALPSCDLPIDQRRKEGKTVGRTVQIALDQVSTNDVGNVVQRMKCTPYVFFAGLVALLLSRYYESDDVILGLPFTGRTHPETQTMVGMFVNTVPLRIKIDEEESLPHYFDKMQSLFVKATEHQDYTYSDILQQLAIPASGGRTPLFDVFFNYMDDSLCFKLENKEFKATEIPTENKMAKFDLTFDIIQKDAGYTLEATYRADLFEEETILRMLHHLETLISWALHQKNEKLVDARILPKKELALLSNAFQSDKDTSDIPFPYLLRKSAEQWPQHPALVYENKRMTYQQLNVYTDKIASALVKQGLQTEDIVGIYAEVGFAPFLGAIATMKAGGAYLPLDPSYPKERLHYMIQKSQAKVVLYDDSVEKPKFSGVICLAIQDVMKAELLNLPKIQSDQLAYVIFTSGSTGKPKGVMIEHRSLSNLIDWNNRFYKITNEDRTIKYASFSFDASVHEMYPQLAAGATIHIIPSSIRLDLHNMWRFIQERKITVAYFPTPIGEGMVRYINAGHVDASKQSLRLMIMGGDRLREWTPHFVIGNNYGPTEGTVLSTAFLVEKGYPSIPIGRPIDNAHVDILDERGRLQPIGVPGEIYLRGMNVARGYIQDDQRSGEVFGRDPKTGDRTYRTGDRGKWLADGTILYLGRKDAQLKIRGNRVELGEIEIAAKRANLTMPVALVQGTAPDLHLVLFYIDSAPANPTSLRQKLRIFLPEYMIPERFVALKTYPMTPNGKIDYHALLMKTSSQMEHKVESRTLTPEETVIFEAWKRALPGVEFGLDDPFFEVGGSSLTLVTMVADVSTNYPDLLQVAEVFAHPTIREMAEIIVAHRNSQESAELKTMPIGERWNRTSAPCEITHTIKIANRYQKDTFLAILFYVLLRLNGKEDGHLYLRTPEGRYQALSLQLQGAKTIKDLEVSIQRERKTIDLNHGAWKSSHSGFTFGIWMEEAENSISEEEVAKIPSEFDLYLQVRMQEDALTLCWRKQTEVLDSQLLSLVIKQLQEILG